MRVVKIDASKQMASCALCRKSGEEEYLIFKGLTEKLRASNYAEIASWK